MSRNRVYRTRSFYGATIDKIEREHKAGRTYQPGDVADFRVWFHDADGTGNALMHPSANTEHVRVGQTADVIRNGNGRIVMLRRPDTTEETS